MSAKTKVVLFLGEKDGDDFEIDSAETAPQLLFAVPNLDEDKITKTKGDDAKQELRDKLATLAYKYDPELTKPGKHIMRRTPELDKVVQQ